MNTPRPNVILMIDDSPFFVRHVERMCAARVAGEGGAWASASSPTEGLAQAGHVHPELVLLDPTMHFDDSRLADFCRELLTAAAPTVPAFLFLHNPAQRLDGVLGRLTGQDGLIVDALAKPFGPPELTGKIDSLLLAAEVAATPSPSDPMPPPPLSAPRFAWLSTTAEVNGHAHLAADGAILEWSGDAQDQGPHSALIYLQGLANLCGDDLGLGPVVEVQTVGPTGSCLSVNVGEGSTLNVLSSPRANLRAIAARVVEAAE